MKTNFRMLFPFHFALSVKRPSIDSIYSIGAGCRACGNPAYTACVDSCPLFDD